jgi:hypothetical protein
MVWWEVRPQNYRWREPPENGGATKCEETEAQSRATSACSLRRRSQPSFGSILRPLPGGPRPASSPRSELWAVTDATGRARFAGCWNGQRSDRAGKGLGRSRRPIGTGPLWRGTESNRRHRGFQPRALPTELPRRGDEARGASRPLAGLTGFEPATSTLTGWRSGPPPGRSILAPEPGSRQITTRGTSGIEQVIEQVIPGSSGAGSSRSWIRRRRGDTKSPRATCCSPALGSPSVTHTSTVLGRNHGVCVLRHQSPPCP